MDIGNSEDKNKYKAEGEDKGDNKVNNKKIKRK